jgi:hypothetical protein
MYDNHTLRVINIVFTSVFNFYVRIWMCHAHQIKYPNKNIPQKGNSFVNEPEVFLSLLFKNLLKLTDTYFNDYFKPKTIGFLR